jgi:hypothetical protein
VPRDGRLDELLERYPDQLDDDELAELRAAAEADPDVDAAMDAIHRAEALLTGSEPAPLSEQGEQRLDALVDEAKGWSTGGATPTAKVSDLAEARRRRHWLIARPAATALAALLLVAAGFMVRDQFRPESPEWTTRGDEDRVDGELVLMGQRRLVERELRSTQAPITFRAVMEGSASLVLLESQAGQTFVLFPEPGDAWVVDVGTTMVTGVDSPLYRPARPGPAVYTLLGSLPEAPIPVPPDRRVHSAAALLDAQEGTWIVGQHTIHWAEVR